MKILTYSDIHLEFAHHWLPPKDIDGDLMILAGDIISLKDYRPLNCFLSNWSKPVLYVPGNHEYYTQKPMKEENDAFKAWLSIHHPNVNLLLDEAITINCVNFFGGTMWTNFNNADKQAMETARLQMNDFCLIQNSSGKLLKPSDTVILHEAFVKKLLDWFQQDLVGPRIVVTHHAPIINLNTQYRDSPLMPAFNSLDMIEIIRNYQPGYWIYGHTHECDDQTVGKTRIISNQLGYPVRPNRYECSDFEQNGKPIVVAFTSEG